MKWNVKLNSLDGRSLKSLLWHDDNPKRRVMIWGNSQFPQYLSIDLTEPFCPTQTVLLIFSTFYWLYANSWSNIDTFLSLLQAVNFTLRLVRNVTANLAPDNSLSCKLLHNGIYLHFNSNDDSAGRRQGDRSRKISSPWDRAVRLINCEPGGTEEIGIDYKFPDS